jgi:hypothetical protein
MSDLPKERIEYYRGQTKLHNDVEVDNSELNSILDQLARQSSLISRLKEDAEMLAKDFTYWSESGDCNFCIHCGENDYDKNEIVHAPDCPVILHNNLMHELDGEK